MSTHPPPFEPEILAPAGDMAMAQAAVHNGAHAIYVGMPGFNARGRAPTLTIEQLREIITFCHTYGVRVYVALNVLIFEQELGDVQARLREVIDCFPDAFIVQDLGVVQLIRSLAPGQPVHASTQMTVTSAEAIRLLEPLGMERYILGREVSIPEIQKIRAVTDAPLEVFVHGALCVSYSGQCLTSERVGGRSANRGQCAQSCRLPYDLVVDGKVKDLGAKRYLVSPQDLCGLGEVRELRDLGVQSFKIEGRLKSPEYVAATVRAYRTVLAGTPLPEGAHDDLAVLYSRGFFSGWLRGVNHQALVDGRYSNHHGARIGEITKVQGDSFIVAGAGVEDLTLGDGVVCADFEGQNEIGGSIYSVQPAQQGILVSLGRQVNYSEIRPGMTLFLNHSEALTRDVRRTFHDRELLKRIPLKITVRGTIGSPLTVSALDPEGREVLVASSTPLVVAQKAPLNQESVLAELGALSQTPYRIESCVYDLTDPVFLHTRELKELRRAMVQAMTERRVARVSHCRPVRPPEHSHVPSTGVSSPELRVLIRDAAQVPALQGSAVSWVYLDYEFGKDYEPSLRALREMGLKVAIATTRIMKPGEQGHLKLIERLRPDGVLVRNLGALHYLRDLPFVKAGAVLCGDFSLNVANSLTAAWLMGQGLASLSPSYDLNYQQLFELVAAAKGIPFEVTLHHYMPAFHMEHCVFAAFLSTGTSYRDCGKPCEKFRVELRDQSSISHPLRADAECRNTMFHGEPQSAAKLMSGLQERGVHRYRLEALFETPAQLAAKISLYSDLVQGKLPAAELYKRLGISERYGVSDGQLLSIGTYQDRKKSYPGAQPTV